LLTKAGGANAEAEAKKRAVAASVNFILKLCVCVCVCVFKTFRKPPCERKNVENAVGPLCGRRSSSLEWLQMMQEDRRSLVDVSSIVRLRHGRTDGVNRFIHGLILWAL
jgi:hypothetical protein